MPFAIILIGIMLISSGARNRAGQLGALIADDFSGQGNFFVWVAAIGAVGATGYYEPMRPVSRLFLFLVLLSMLLSNRGFFANLLDAVQNFQAPPPVSTSDTGAATADPGAGITGNPVTDSTAPALLGDLITKYGNVDKIPDDAALPSDVHLPTGVALKTMGDFRQWFKTLPTADQTGGVAATLNRLSKSDVGSYDFGQYVDRIGKDIGLPTWMTTPLFGGTGQ